MDIDRFVADGKATEWVSVSLEPVPGGYHSGLLYRDANGKLHRLHFGWHRTLYAVPYTDVVACAQLKLDEADAMFISGYCEKIAKNSANREIPYNLKCDPDVEFDGATGAVRFGENSTGLGCGTFVVAVFRSSGNPLVEMTNWPPPTAADIERQKVFVAMLRNSKIKSSQEQARVIEREVGTKRIRPEHVAGACLEDIYPATHERCFPNGEAIIAKMLVS